MFLVNDGCLKNWQGGLGMDILDALSDLATILTASVATMAMAHIASPFTAAG